MLRKSLVKLGLNWLRITCRIVVELRIPVLDMPWILPIMFCYEMRQWDDLQ
jgi:hypothetical protein